MVFTLLEHGFPAVVTFAVAGTIELGIVDITPPGFEAGGKIETTTMGNVRYRTAAAKKLITISGSTLTVAYDPKILSTIEANTGKNGKITVTFADLSSWDVYGWIESFKPNRLSEDERPTGAMMLEYSNRDGTGAEVGPVYNAPPP